MSVPGDYLPGVCNIGGAEVRQRRLVGWVGLLVTVALWGGLVYFGAARTWRLVLVVPASLAATGYLQAASRFCATYGLLGVVNFGPHVGRTERIVDAESRRRDRRAALRIFALSALTGAVVAAAAWLAPPGG